MPVTVICVVPILAKVHDSVAVPDPVTLEGVTLHEALLVVKDTAPLNPLRDARVRAELAGLPALTVREVGFAASVKSWTE